MTFLRNTWYVFGWSSDLDDGPVGRTIADQPVMVFRDEDGGLAALRDRCPHRFMSLSRGKVIEGRIECPYHGLQFDSSGRCMLNPLTNEPLPSAWVATFPVVERYSLLWLWLGDLDVADPDLIPDFGFLTKKGRATVRGYTVARAGYQLAIDNLNDLTHVQFVHREYQASEAYGRLDHRTWQDGDTVYRSITFPNGRPANFFHSVIDPERHVDVTFTTRWDMPSLIKLTASVTEPGRPEAYLFGNHSAHLVSPETETSCHYFYAHSRDYQVDDSAADAAVAEWQRVGFSEQDKPIIERQQANIGTDELMDLLPLILPTDAAAIRARRILALRIKREQRRVGPAETKIVG